MLVVLSGVHVAGRTLPCSSKETTMIHASALRRFGALALALGIALSLPALTEAAPALPHASGWHAISAARPLSESPRTARYLGALSVHTPRPLLRTAARAAQAVTDPTKLAFTPPANATNVQAGTVSTAAADDPQQNFFAHLKLNPQTYAAAGMQTGYGELFSMPIGTGSDVVVVDYLATIYASADQATARVNSTIQSLTAQGATSQTCGTGCADFAIALTSPSGPSGLLYLVFSNNNVAVELGFVIGNDVLSANQTAFGNIVQQISTLVFNAVLGPAPANFGIVDFEVVHTVKGKAKITHKLKSGESGLFIADLQLPNASDTIQAQVTFTVGKKTVGPLLLGNPQTASDGSVLVGAKHKFKVKKTTKVVAHLQVQDGTAQATKDLTFKVTA
jgi:hypothetical protein